jgi:hypothetical protein
MEVHECVHDVKQKLICSQSQVQPVSGVKVLCAVCVSTCLPDYFKPEC